MIEAEGLTKRFGVVRAIKGVDLRVEDGSCVAVLGPNGSGKSTLLQLLAGLLRPTSGAVRIGSQPPRLVKARLGYLGHEPFLYRYLSARENLTFYADLYGVEHSNLAEVLHRVRLDHKPDALVGTLSRGETQRLGLARALLHDPDYVLLDEPFTGLDDQSADLLPGLLARPGRTTVLTTHDRARAVRVSDRFLHLEDGRLR